jgi:UDP-N-acetylmuramoyl-L-alanyl-D-glutamate--2,6-diaminopimelate ligase
MKVMTLAHLLAEVPVTKMFQTTFGQMAVTHDVEIAGVQYNSGKVKQGEMFVALRGTTTDGHRFVSDAISRGAKAVVMEDDDAMPDSYFMHTGVVKIIVSNSRRALAQLAAAWYGHPARSLRIVGVTGTNGKTTTVYLIHHLLQQSGKKAGLIGTIETIVGSERTAASQTTPESLELHAGFARMVSAGCTEVVMEVSSHALHQDRVFGIDFASAVFTNLTQDHLDYHGTMDNYFAEKKILFDGLSATSTAVLNLDDPFGKKIAADTSGRRLSYGYQTKADVTAHDIVLEPNGTRFVLAAGGVETPMRSPLAGRFNVANVLAAASAALAGGLSLTEIHDGIGSFTAVPGRFERVASPRGWMAIIDYAHTPDALEKSLMSLREVMPADRPGRVITVFGAGGDRDKTKRPLMGAIAEKLSDVVIVTSDNPRTEDPERIIDEICCGIKNSPALIRESNRGAAIGKACAMARPGDVLLIAGKGHEDYQVIGTTKHHFSDRETVRALL